MGEADSQNWCPTSPPLQGGKPGPGHSQSDVFVVKGRRWERLRAKVGNEEIVETGIRAGVIWDTVSTAVLSLVLDLNGLRTT